MKKYLLTIIILLMSYPSFAQVQISNLITPVTYFVNHIRQLTLLQTNLVKYKQASIIGISGMGKTQLARMYGYESKNNYDLIWFIDCNLDINEEFLKLAKSINIATNSNIISEDGLSAKKEVITYLSSQDKWLLVFDNLKVKENQKISDFVTWEHNGNIIFCSQDSDILPNIVRMIAFEKSDAIILTNNILENSDTKLAEFLVQEFVGYPILIVQGAQLLNQVPGLDLEEYRRKIGQSTDKIKLNVTLAIKELKPNARELLHKIALINNQAFSKDLLRIIANDQSTLGDDIYQLSKFALISHIDSNETNPIFEMHDVIAQKITEISEDKDNRRYLEKIITRLVQSIPKNVTKAHIFRTARTIQDNFEVILNNGTKYDVNINKIIVLNLQLLIQYVNSLDFYNAEKLINWFDQHDRDGKFNVWLMDNNKKHIYAAYLQIIGGYYARCADYKTANNYYIKAKKVIDNIKGHELLKFNIIFSLTLSDIFLGQLQVAEKNMQIIEEMFATKLVDTSEFGMLYFIKARLFFAQAQYHDALEYTDRTITACIQNGLHAEDLLLINPYVLKAEILNILGKYNEAFTQAKQLYNMCKSSKKEDHEVFGRIFTQMAKAELGLGKIDEALAHAQKSITIYKFWYNKFSHQLTDKFGKEHFRSQELLSLSDRCKN